MSLWKAAELQSRLTRTAAGGKQHCCSSGASVQPQWPDSILFLLILPLSTAMSASCIAV